VDLRPKTDTPWYSVALLKLANSTSATESTSSIHAVKQIRR